MTTDTDNVVWAFDAEPEPGREPAPLRLPERSPTPQEIRMARFGRTRKEAAELCGVDPRHWRRWETGESDMPRATWAWLRVATSGGALDAIGGPDWEGWSIHQGRIYSPEGWGGFTPGELRSWPYLHAQLSELRRQVHKVQEENEVLRAENQRMTEGMPTERQKAAGQLDALSAVVGVLMNEYSEAEDPRLQQLSKTLHDTLFQTCHARAELYGLASTPPTA